MPRNMCSIIKKKKLVEYVAFFIRFGHHKNRNIQILKKWERPDYAGNSVQQNYTLLSGRVSIFLVAI